jgi:hypothetical protein
VGRRLCLTALRSYSKFYLPIDYNVDKQVTPLSVPEENITEILENFDKFLVGFANYQTKFGGMFKSWFNRDVKQLKHSNLRVTTKAGPNGPAVVSSH